MEDKEPYVPIELLAKHFYVSISTIRAWVRSGKIPKSTYIKLGNTYRFKVSLVEQALVTGDEPEEDTSEKLNLDFSAGI